MSPLSNLRWCVISVIAMATGCAHDLADECPGMQPGFSAGIFGCDSTSSDTSGEGPQPVQDELVTLKHLDSPTVEMGTTNRYGYYEIAAPAGTYKLCLTRRPVCTDVELTDEQPLAAWDYESGEGIGWSERR